MSNNNHDDDEILFSAQVQLPPGISIPDLASGMVAELRNGLAQKGTLTESWPVLQTLEFEARLGLFEIPPRNAAHSQRNKFGKPAPNPALSNATPGASVGPRWQHNLPLMPQPRLLAAKTFAARMFVPERSLFNVAMRAVEAEWRGRFATMESKLGTDAAKAMLVQKQPLTADIFVMEGTNKERVSVDLRTLVPKPDIVQKWRKVVLDFGVATAPLDVRLCVSAEENAWVSSRPQQNNNNRNSNNRYNQRAPEPEPLDMSEEAVAKRRESLCGMALETMLVSHLEPEMVSDADEEDEDEEQQRDGQDDDDAEKQTSAPKQQQQQQQKEPAVAFGADGTSLERRKLRRSFLFDNGIIVELTEVLSDGLHITLEVEIEWDVKHALECARQKVVLLGRAEAERSQKMINSVMDIVEEEEQQQKQDGDGDDAAEKQQKQKMQEQVAARRELKEEFLMKGVTSLAQTALTLTHLLKKSSAAGQTQQATTTAAGIRQRDD